MCASGSRGPSTWRRATGSSAEVGAALDGADGLELDLRELDYIDSIGLAAIIEASRLAERDTLQKARLLISETGPVRRMLELTLLHLTLDVRVGVTCPACATAPTASPATRAAARAAAGATSTPTGAPCATRG